MAQLGQPDLGRRSTTRSREESAGVSSEKAVVSTFAPVSSGAAGGARPANDLVAAPVERKHSVFAHLAVHDWMLGIYFVLLGIAVLFGSPENKARCLEAIALDLGIFWTGVLIARSDVLWKRGTFANGLFYRLTLFLTFQFSYFQLREILPQVTSRVLDADILAFDLSVFGYEPAIAWDRFVNPQTTEWFAFFYFSYFFLLVIHVIPMMVADRNAKRLAHFCLGIFSIYVIGHLVYMIVPGFGPYRHLKGQFTNELEGGLFWRLVKTTVEAGGAQKDIFPSLHTATPTFFAIFSYIHRRSLPFRYTWPILSFFAAQIILATMFLRWHWLIDVFAGLALSFTAAFGSRAIVNWEWARRARLGISPIFEPLAWPKSEEKVTPTDVSANSC